MFIPGWLSARMASGLSAASIRTSWPPTKLPEQLRHKERGAAQTAPRSGGGEGGVVSRSPRRRALARTCSPKRTPAGEQTRKPPPLPRRRSARPATRADAAVGSGAARSEAARSARRRQHRPRPRLAGRPSVARSAPRSRRHVKCRPAVWSTDAPTTGSRSSSPRAGPGAASSPGGCGKAASRAARRRRPRRSVRGEGGETKGAAAIREVREETGMTAEIEADLGDTKYMYVWDDIRIRKTVHFFLMRHTGGNVDDRDDEMEEIRWFPLERAIKRAAYRGERDMLVKASELLK